MSEFAHSRPSGRTRNNYFDGLPISEPQTILFGMLMLLYFFQQYCNWNFAYLSPAFVHSQGLDASGGYRFVATVAACFALGQGLGAVVTGLLSDRYGRRIMLLTSLVVFTVAGTLNGLATSPWTFILARSITGYGVFSVMVVTNTYIAEFAPAQSRGKLQSIIAMVGFTAPPVVAILSWATAPVVPDSWRYILYFSGVGLLPICLALIFIKESPRWLVGKGRVAEAEAIMAELCRRGVPLAHLSGRPGKAVSLRETVKLLSGGGYRRRFFSQLALYGLGIPALFNILIWPPILLDAEVGLEPGLRISAWLAVFIPLGCLLPAYLSDSLGRRQCLTLMLLLAGVGAVGYGLCPPDSDFLIPLGILNVLGTMGGTFGLFTYTAESFPTGIRNTAVGIVQGFGRLGMIVFQLPTYWLAEAYGRSGVYLLAGALLLLLVPLLVFSTENTAGKSLEELNVEAPPAAK